jgi:Tfp pilus assembly protein PilF/lysophospholipase L1-like esterase
MTTRRRLFFILITVFFPLLFLGALEGVFRLTGLFAPEPLLVDVPDSDGNRVGFNPFVGRRYFDASQTAVPMLTPEVFERTKTPSTFRVLCLGESSTAGFPFDCQVPFPRQLRRLLSEAYPEKRIEVLNAGMAAISSSVIVDLLPELLEVSPDLVLVYSGHNEFYGVYGSSSALAIGRSDALIRASLAMQRTRVGQMMRQGLSLLRPSPPESTATEVLMRRVIGEQEIALGSPRYMQTMEMFRTNLERIADACAERKIPVILGTLVCNDRDQEPFQSVLDSSKESAVVLRAELQNGEQCVAAGDWRGASASFDAVLKNSPAHAGAWFGAARALLLKGDTVAARTSFVKARDLDAMRFRASTEANTIIAGVARAKGTGLVDLADILSARSSGRVIGREWMCDHLHPTPQGYYVMAAAYYIGIQRLRMLPPPDPNFRPRQAAYGVTPLDWDIGFMKIFLMTHRWPFREQRVTLDDYVPVGDSTTARVARAYLFEHNVWSTAHNTMAQEHMRKHDFEAARREYEAVAVFSPDDPWPFRMIADTYEAEDNWPMRSLALREAIRRPGPQGMLAYQLGLCEMKNGQMAKAIRAMGVAAEAPEFTPEERANARFHLAGLLSDIGQKDEAINILQIVLREDSVYAPARRLLMTLEGIR